MVLVDVLPWTVVEITLSNMINNVPAILSLSNVRTYLTVPGLRRLKSGSLLRRFFLIGFLFTCDTF